MGVEKLWISLPWYEHIRHTYDENPSFLDTWIPRISSSKSNTQYQEVNKSKGRHKYLHNSSSLLIFVIVINYYYPSIFRKHSFRIFFSFNLNKMINSRLKDRVPRKLWCASFLWHFVRFLHLDHYESIYFRRKSRQLSNIILIMFKMFSKIVLCRSYKCM